MFFTMGYIYCTRSVWNACSEATISVETSSVALSFEPGILLTFCVSFFKTKSPQCISVVLADVTLYTRGLGRPRGTWQTLFSVQIPGVQAVQITALSGRIMSS